MINWLVIPCLRRWRQFTSIVLSVGMLALVLRLPLPAIIDKPGTEDFPCKHHACGCLDAEMCRTHCCCFKTTAAPKKGGSCCAHKAAADDKHASSSGTRLQSPECGGLAYTMIMHGVLLVPYTAHTVPNALPVGARLVLAPDASPLEVSLSPATPPPRA
ncbi:MAG: hypothetical protein H6817_11690 [Phycisphaerales bacterium]|nr:hypothetical protein [Phycisphaerales bacterium]